MCFPPLGFTDAYSSYRWPLRIAHLRPLPPPNFSLLRVTARGNLSLPGLPNWWVCPRWDFSPQKLPPSGFGICGARQRPGFVPLVTPSGFLPQAFSQPGSSLHTSSKPACHIRRFSNPAFSFIFAPWDVPVLDQPQISRNTRFAAINSRVFHLRCAAIYPWSNKLYVLPYINSRTNDRIFMNYGMEFVPLDTVLNSYFLIYLLVTSAQSSEV
jgi:hypothetical protein